MDLKLSLLPAQARLVNSRSKIVAFVGGVGSGKTRGAVYKSTVLGFENSPCVGLFIEPTYTMIRDVAVRSFQEVYDEIGMPYEYFRSDHIMRVADNFDILFRSGDQPDRLIGVNAGWAGIDEPASQDEEVAKMALARARDPKAKCRQLFLTGTPQGFNWYYDWCHHPDTEVIRARTYDNPYLDVAYVEEMKKRYTDEEIRAYIEGEFIRFEGAWYKLQPPVRPYSITSSGLKVFRDPHNCSSQICIGVDTAGGLGRDRSAIAAIDKQDGALIASWVSATATINQMVEIVLEAGRLYTKEHPSILPPYVRAAVPSRPVVLVEVDGIGRAAWQQLALRDNSLPMVQLNTKDATRYSGLLAAKRAVEAGTLGGPEELADEARELFVENGKFKGPKDLSMAIGFCLNHIRDNPYTTGHQQVSRETLDLMGKIPGRHKGW